MTDQYFLTSLKEGDKVAIEHYYYGDITYTVTEIERITPTRQIKVKGYDGRFINGELPMHSSGIHTTLVPVTDMIIEKAERMEILKYISEYKFNKCDTEKLRLIKGILEGEN